MLDQIFARGNEALGLLKMIVAWNKSPADSPFTLDELIVDAKELLAHAGMSSEDNCEQDEGGVNEN